MENGYWTKAETGMRVFVRKPTETEDRHGAYRIIIREDGEVLWVERGGRGDEGFEYTMDAPDGRWWWGELSQLVVSGDGPARLGDVIAQAGTDLSGYHAEPGMIEGMLENRSGPPEYFPTRSGIPVRNVEATRQLGAEVEMAECLPILLAAGPMGRAHSEVKYAGK